MFELTAIGGLLWWLLRKPKTTGTSTQTPSTNPATVVDDVVQQPAVINTCKVLEYK